MIKVPPEKSPDEWTNGIKGRKYSFKAFTVAMSHPMKIPEEQFKWLILDGHPVEVRPYPGNEGLNMITDVILEYGPSYDLNIIIKLHLINITITIGFLSSSNHCLEIEYTLTCVG